MLPKGEWNRQNFTLKDHQGKVMFQTGGGTTITVASLEHITAIGDANTVICRYAAAAPRMPASLYDLLLDP